MNDHTSCTFLSSGVGYGRRAGYPTSKVLGANERIRVGMIGVGDSPSIWQTFLQEQTAAHFGGRKSDSGRILRGEAAHCSICNPYVLKGTRLRYFAIKRSMTKKREYLETIL